MAKIMELVTAETLQKMGYGEEKPMRVSTYQTVKAIEPFLLAAFGGESNDEFKTEEYKKQASTFFGPKGWDKNQQ